MMNLLLSDGRTATAMHWSTWTCRVRRGRRRPVPRVTLRCRSLFSPPSNLEASQAPSFRGKIVAFFCICAQENDMDGSELDSSNDEEEWKSDSSRYRVEIAFN